MDDSRAHRRKNLKTFLSGKLGVGLRFDSAQRNVFLWKGPKIMRRYSKFGSNSDNIRSGMEPRGTRSEETSSEGSCFRNSWKSFFPRPLSWMKLNFFGSSSLKKYHATPPLPLKKSGSLLSAPKLEACNSSCPKIEPSVETEHQKENSDGTMTEANEGKDCDDVKENDVRDCDDVSEKEGICSEKSSECGDGFCDEEEECGGGDDAKGSSESEDDCDVEEGYGHNNGSLRKKFVRNYPPPLPSLARTGNLPCHMPWIHLRSYKTDGRLVIQEVKVRHHEFFRASRANGRLTLHLVQHDEDKVRAQQAGLFKSEAKEAAIDERKEDIDRREENKEMGSEEKSDNEAENVHNEETNGGNDLEDTEKRNGGNDLEDTEKQNGGTDMEGVEKRIGGEVERVIGDEGGDEVLHCKRSFARERLIPDSLQMRRQRFSGSHLQANSSAVGYGSKSLESPVGCCSPVPNPFFDRPISAIRPILS